MSPESCAGILLAAGAGRRYGMPKVLAADGAWLRAGVAALRGGGCERVVVVLGATGPAYRAGDGRWLVSQTSGIAIPEGAQPVWAADWDAGVSASMRAGLAAAAVPAARIAAVRNTSVRNVGAGNSSIENDDAGRARTAGLVAIMPVDTPDVGPDVVARVIAAARASESRLARAVFGGAPGHPVVLGRAHWAGVCASAAGNSGAGTYLRQRADMVCVTCDDLATGIDRDYPAGSAL
ncbi:nucleotidyltransferase family protein [Nocardia yunnanensis]|uniref:Nucleotidyltransferase family protein n=1 Tax=Nocardia yunnanensis TaxID=2382165 RepID=A0A386ZMU6_9NOCA|nr:NTP transferase domain-containing protein [Nocardia yunnanensis]AYF78768.1 nucleotidyltransferase family protein [Nocardia yunnanensis]